MHVKTHTDARIHQIWPSNHLRLLCMRIRNSSFYFISLFFLFFYESFFLYFSLSFFLSFSLSSLLPCFLASFFIFFCKCCYHFGIILKSILIMHTFQLNVIVHWFINNKCCKNWILWWSSFILSLEPDRWRLLVRETGPPLIIQISCYKSTSNHKWDYNLLLTPW